MARPDPAAQPSYKTTHHAPISQSSLLTPRWSVFFYFAGLSAGFPLSTAMIFFAATSLIC